MLIVKHVVRAKIAALNLPRAYQALGKHVFNAGSYRTDFASIFQQIDGHLDAIKAVQPRSADEQKSEGTAGKARAPVQAVKDVAHVKTLKMARTAPTMSLAKWRSTSSGCRADPMKSLGQLPPAFHESRGSTQKSGNSPHNGADSYAGAACSRNGRNGWAACGSVYRLFCRSGTWQAGGIVGAIHSWRVGCSKAECDWTDV